MTASVGFAAPAAPAPSIAVVLVATGVVAALVSGGRRRRARADLRDRCVGGVARPVTTSSARPHPPLLVADLWGTTEVAIGAAALRLVRRADDRTAARRLGRSLLVGALTAGSGVGPFVAVGLAVAVWVVPLATGLARRARERAALVDELPEVVDLVRLGVGSGLNVRLALEAVVRHHDGAIAAELRDVLARADRGERLADALDRVTRSGTAVAPLIDALVATERYGAPLVRALDRVAADARSARRRRREEAARRVPVMLLFPLVFCTLPAFALLTVVPVLLRSLPSLSP